MGTMRTLLLQTQNGPSSQQNKDLGLREVLVPCSFLRGVSRDNSSSLCSIYNGKQQILLATPHVVLCTGRIAHNHHSDLEKTEEPLRFTAEETMAQTG